MHDAHKNKKEKKMKKKKERKDSVATDTESVTSSQGRNFTNAFFVIMHIYPLCNTHNQTLHPYTQLRRLWICALTRWCAIIVGHLYERGSWNFPMIQRGSDQPTTQQLYPLASPNNDRTIEFCCEIQICEGRKVGNSYLHQFSSHILSMRGLASPYSAFY